MTSGLFSSGRPVVAAKTAAYTVTALDEGKIFTNRGASGSVTFTLPVTTNLPVGWACRFIGVADQNLVVASNGSADNITTFNDATADSITFSTAGELIGSAVEVVWDGTSWLAFLMINETATPTIA